MEEREEWALGNQVGIETVLNDKPNLSTDVFLPEW